MREKKVGEEQVDDSSKLEKYNLNWLLLSTALYVISFGRKDHTCSRLAKLSSQPPISSSINSKTYSRLCFSL